VQIQKAGRRAVKKRGEKKNVRKRRTAYIVNYRKKKSERTRKMVVV